MLAACLLLAGCGGKKPADTRGDPPVEGRAAPKAEPAARPTPDKPEFETSVTGIQLEYSRNEFKADEAYKGKWGQITAHVLKMGRTDDGTPFIADSGIAAAVEPNLWLYFPKTDGTSLGSLKVGDRVTVVGRCTGKRKDGHDRGIADRDWRIEFTDCRLSEAKR